MKNKENKPLTFRLYQSVRFNRPLDKDNDLLSPGGYELKMRDADGTEKSVQFDFLDFAGKIDDNDESVVHMEQKNPDYECYPEIKDITEHMLRNIIEVVEWFMYTGEVDDSSDTEDVLTAIEVFDVEFEIIEGTDNGTEFIKIPVTLDIKPSGGTI